MIISNRARLIRRRIIMPTATVVLFFCLGASLIPQQIARGGERMPDRETTPLYSPAFDPALAQNDRLTANDGIAGSSFGNSIAISGNTAVIGSEFDDIDGATDQGSAYVFVNNGTTWTQQAKLIAENGFRGERFGGSLAIDGDTIVIGARFDGDGGIASGAAYVFTRNGTTWTQQAKLTASDGTDLKLFGGAVALSGDIIIVGAIGDNSKGDLAGAAYVFIRNGTTWTEQAKLTASDGAEDDEFGGSVAISGDTTVIGAEFDSVGANEEQGSVYVFTRNGTTWTQQAKLFANDAAADDGFGDSVAINGNTIVVGSTFDSIGATISQGSAYVFTRNGTTWTQQAKLFANDGAFEDSFGTSVAINGNTIVVGSPFSSIAGKRSSGSAYVFARQGAVWSQKDKLIASDGAEFDFFGGAVAIGENAILVGAVGSEVGASDNQGSAYGFALDATPPNAPPSVSIVKPKDGKSLPSGKRKVKIKANASDSDGTVTIVEFFQGDTKIGDDTTDPYVFKWKNVSPGTYTITVRVTDDKGAVTISSPVTVTVN